MPFFTSFQYSDDGFCSSGGRIEGHAVFDYYDAIKQCIEGDGINIDKFMFWVMRGAKEIGHSSIILSQLDIPVSPNQPLNPERKKVEPIRKARNKQQDERARLAHRWVKNIGEYHEAHRYFAL